MMVLRLSSFCVCLLALAVAVQGYIPSTHKSYRSVPPKQTVKLEPVLQKNPLSVEQRQEKVSITPEADLGQFAPVESSVTPLPVEHVAQKKQDAAVAVVVAAAEPPIKLPTKQDLKQPLFVASSAALAGFTDVLCLAQFSCFVNMMTGNILKMITAVVNSQRPEAMIQASFVLCYALGVSIFTQMKQRVAFQEEEPLAPLRFMAPLVAVLFVSADLLVLGCGGGRSIVSAKALQVPFLAMGFGVVNSAAGHATGGTVFFALTGHLTKMTNTLNDVLALRSSFRSIDVATKKSVSVVSSFMGGALVAAILRQRILPFMVARNLWVPPLCTSLGLMYAALFAWYAPLKATASWKRLPNTAKFGLQNTVRRMRPNPREAAAALIPEAEAPILVDINNMASSTNVLYQPPMTVAAAQGVSS
jgi:uncharacterized membrane protein YoaK (UPF0700 family)